MEAERRPERPPAERSSPGQTPEEGAEALAEFAALHGPALRASGVPERYWGRLLHKLEHEMRTLRLRGSLQRDSFSRCLTGTTGTP